MTPEELKALYGAEYPAAVVHDGIRMPLVRESRFARGYHSEEYNTGYMASRFADGSASMTAAELQAQWQGLTETDRLDFCQHCGSLHKQSDFPDMLRFVMAHSGPREWGAIALCVASKLPRDEAFDLLVQALRSVDISGSTNIAQAIAWSRHPEAEKILRQHLGLIWQDKTLWDNAEFINWVGYAATTCIEHLLELGAAAVELESMVRRLAEHPCANNRESCRSLAKYYSWLGAPRPGAQE